MSKCDKPPRMPKSPQGNGQFKATTIWKDLASHLYQNANVKRRRVLMKSHNDCFSGCNAVDTLLGYVKTNPSKFPNTNMVARENICRLCQSFMDADIFVCVNVGENSEKKSKFEDSTSRLYRFNHDSQSRIMSDDALCESSPNTLKRNGTSNLAYSNDPPINLQFQSPAIQNSQQTTFRQTMMSPFIAKRCDVTNSENTVTNSIAKITPRLKRKASFSRVVMRRSSSHPSLREGISVGCSREAKLRSPGDHLHRSMMRLGERLSFRKKTFRCADQSGYQIHKTKVFKNFAAEDELVSKTENVSVKNNASYRTTKSVLPNDDCKNIQALSSKPRKRKLSQHEKSQLMRESVRVRLLQLLDLSFVEAVVLSPVLEKKMLTGISSAEQHTDKFDSMSYGDVASAYDVDDVWFFNAVAVLQHIPEGYDMLRKCASLPIHKKKVELYSKILDYYKSLETPLIDKNFNAVATAIINLLDFQPIEKVLEPMQLFLHLLPDTVLTQLRHLCMFLDVVCNENQIRLVRKESNQAVVVDAFTPCILQIDEPMSLYTGIDGVKGLVLFMLRHHFRAFMLPASIQASLQKKIGLLEQGEIESPSALSDIAYCSIISEAEYMEQKVQFTQKEVLNLYKDIQESAIPLKKKKELLQKLQEQHREFFQIHDQKSVVERSIEKKKRPRSHSTRSKSILPEVNTKLYVERRPSTVSVSVPTSFLCVGASTAPLPRKRRTVTKGDEVFV